MSEETLAEDFDIVSSEHDVIHTVGAAAWKVNQYIKANIKDSDFYTEKDGITLGVAVLYIADCIYAQAMKDQDEEIVTITGCSYQVNFEDRNSIAFDIDEEEGEQFHEDLENVLSSAKQPFTNDEDYYINWSIWMAFNLLMASMDERPGQYLHLEGYDFFDHIFEIVPPYRGAEDVEDGSKVVYAPEYLGQRSLMSAEYPNNINMPDGYMDSGVGQDRQIGGNVFRLPR